MATADTAENSAPTLTGEQTGEEIIACLQIIAQSVGRAIAEMRADTINRLDEIDLRLARIDTLLLRVEAADAYRAALARTAAGLHPH